MYHLINENEDGLAVVISEDGNVSLPMVIERPINVTPGIVNSDLFHPIRDIGAICNISILPENLIYTRIKYDEFVNSEDYVTNASLLFRFAGSFIR